MEQIRFTCHIEKSAPDERRFWGRGYIHTTDAGPVEDSSGDRVDTPETQRMLEQAFYEYVKSYRSGDAGHELFEAAEMIEGFVVTKEKKAAGLFPDGMDEGIYVGFEAKATEEGDVLWDGVKEGRYKQLSIVGQGRREPL